MDSVLVVIPCFNQAEYLAEAIESALAQTHPVAVLVVDDGSTDDSAEVARRYPVRLVQQENRGVSAARNAGIAATKSDWIIPLDADDWLDPTTVEMLLGLDDMVAPSCVTFGASENHFVPALRNPTASDFTLVNYSTVSALYRREVWEAVGGYDEDMVHGGEDWDFFVRALGAGFSMTVVSDELVHYRVYDESRGDRPSSSERLRHRLDEVLDFMHDKWRRLGIEHPTKAEAELAFWHGLYEQDGREGFLARRAEGLKGCIRWFPELVTETGRGLDYGCGLVSIFEFAGLDMDAYDPLLEGYRGICEGPGQIRYLDEPQVLYDFIVCKNVIDHTPEPGELLESIERLLKPGGRLYFEVNFDPVLYDGCHYRLWRMETVRHHLARFELVRESIAKEAEYPDIDFYTGVYLHP